VNKLDNPTTIVVNILENTVAWCKEQMPDTTCIAAKLELSGERIVEDEDGNSIPALFGELQCLFDKRPMAAKLGLCFDAMDIKWHSEIEQIGDLEEITENYATQVVHNAEKHPANRDLFIFFNEEYTVITQLYPFSVNIQLFSFSKKYKTQALLQQIDLFEIYAESIYEEYPERGISSGSN